MVRVHTLTAIVLLSSFFWGSVYPWTIVASLTAVCGLAASLPQDWLRGPRITILSFYGIVLAFVVTVTLQILPGILSLAPNNVWVVASETLGDDLPARAAVDLSVLLWRLGPAILYALTFWAALAIGSDRLRARAFLYSAAWGGAVLVVLTLSIFFANEHLLLWHNRPPYTDARSYTHGFVNRNSAGSYLGTFSLLAFGLYFRSIRNLRLTGRRFFSPEVLDELLPAISWQVLPHLLAFLIFTLGLILTASRGGILLTIPCLLFLMVVILVKSLEWFKARLWSILVVSCLALWSLQSWGTSLSERLYGAGLESDRMEVLPAVGNIITDYPLLGVGLGGFPSAFQAYRPTTVSPSVIYDKAHNTFLEITAEMGIPFAVLSGLFWIGLFVVLIRGVIRRRDRFIYPAVGSAIWLLATLHSMVDFPLQIPGHAMTVAAILGVCIAQTVRIGRRR